jgi:hypothetical protein
MPIAGKGERERERWRVSREKKARECAKEVGWAVGG